ncbi:hypothetical protein Avbf_18762 [Armadillidium vulgare]|nr:hypothetical protein Avbf_18762 [Armadillidium vulgare]
MGIRRVRVSMAIPGSTVSQKGDCAGKVYCFCSSEIEHHPSTDAFGCFLSIQLRFSRRILNGTSAKIWYGAKNIAENSIDDYMDRAHFPDYDNYNYMQIHIIVLR